MSRSQRDEELRFMRSLASGCGLKRIRAGLDDFLSAPGAKRIFRVRARVFGGAEPAQAKDVVKVHKACAAGRAESARSFFHFMPACVAEAVLLHHHVFFSR